MIEATIRASKSLSETLSAAYPTWFLSCGTIPVYAEEEKIQLILQNKDELSFDDIYKIGSIILMEIAKKLLPLEEEIAKYINAMRGQEKNTKKKEEIDFSLYLNLIYAVNYNKIDVTDMDQDDVFKSYSVEVGKNPTVKTKEDLRFKLNQRFFDFLRNVIENPIFDSKDNFNKSHYNEKNPLALEFFITISDIFTAKEVLVDEELTIGVTEEVYKNSFLTEAEKMTTYA